MMVARPGLVLVLAGMVLALALVFAPTAALPVRRRFVRTGLPLDAPMATAGLSSSMLTAWWNGSHVQTVRSFPAQDASVMEVPHASKAQALSLAGAEQYFAASPGTSAWAVCSVDAAGRLRAWVASSNASVLAASSWTEGTGVVYTGCACAYVNAGFIMLAAVANSDSVNKWAFNTSSTTLTWTFVESVAVGPWPFDAVSQNKTQLRIVPRLSTSRDFVLTWVTNGRFVFVLYSPLFSPSAPWLTPDTDELWMASFVPTSRASAVFTTSMDFHVLFANVTNGALMTSWMRSKSSPWLKFTSLTPQFVVNDSGNALKVAAGGAPDVIPSLQLLPDSSAFYASFMCPASSGAFSQGNSGMALRVENDGGVMQSSAASAYTLSDRFQTLQHSHVFVPPTASTHMFWVLAGVEESTTPSPATLSLVIAYNCLAYDCASQAPTMATSSPSAMPTVSPSSSSVPISPESPAFAAAVFAGSFVLGTVVLTLVNVATQAYTYGDRMQGMRATGSTTKQ